MSGFILALSVESIVREMIWLFFALINPTYSTKFRGGFSWGWYISTAGM